MFGKFLQEKGEITSQQLHDALTEQRRDIYFFGELAIINKKMTHEQVLHVMNEQIGGNHHGQKFGEVAISRGYITDLDIDDVLLMQDDSHRKTGDILVGHGAISREKCDKYLSEFTEH